MNHSGIISTSRGQHRIQNVSGYVCVYERGLPQFWAARCPALSLPSHFSLSSFLAPPYFPRGNLICRLPRCCPRLSTSFPPSASSLFWVTESTHQLLALFVFQSTILTGVRKITVGSRQNRLLFFFPHCQSRCDLILPSVLPPLFCLLLCCSPLHHPFCCVPASLSNIYPCVLVMMDGESVTVKPTSHPSRTLQQHS